MSRRSIAAAKTPGTSTDGSTLYLKYSPCIHCSKYIVAAGVKRIVMAQVYRNSNAIPYLEDAGVKVEVYKENTEWNETVRSMFEKHVEERKAAEGDVKIKGE